jgi:hypothetical protein
MPGGPKQPPKVCQCLRLVTAHLAITLPADLLPYGGLLCGSFAWCSCCPIKPVPLPYLGCPEGLSTVNPV